ncbi:MAG: hypothetical protein KA794_12775, partial [Candidatus Obscuribacter sp.]|nr:hypothetical protein [Candidatus Obscuribacter sp.]
LNTAKPAVHVHPWSIPPNMVLARNRAVFLAKTMRLNGYNGGARNKVQISKNQVVFIPCDDFCIMSILGSLL